MRPHILRDDDNLAYRYYEEGVIFVNATENQLTAGFSGDTLLRLDAKAEVKSLVELFTLPSDSGAICLYPLNYFKGSGFEPDDRLCWENYCLEVNGITNYGAERISAPCTVAVHSGDWMYQIYGTDVSRDTNLVRFKIFPYDILIKDSTYLSFWINVAYAPGDSAPIGLDCLLKNGKRLRLSEWTKYGTIIDQYGREIGPAGRRVPKGAWYQYVFTFNPAVIETIGHA